MAYIQETKNLLGEDLRSLIRSISGFENGSPEFAELEDSAWHQVLNTYNTSVNDSDVKTAIGSFVEKFLFHGFNQKAKNLRTLVEFYSNLDYFKKKDDKTIQWSMIHLLLRLSHRPTDAPNDDPPLNIEDLVRSEGVVPGTNFDWSSYLKQGWEKFQLPSDDSSVDWTDDEVESELEEIPKNLETLSLPKVISFPPIPNVLQPPKYRTVQEYEQRSSEIAAELHRWIRSQYQKPWWMVPNYCENITSKHPIANYCRTSTTWKRKRGKIDSAVRIVGDRKIVQVLLYALAGAEGGPSCLFECENGHYTVKPDISVSSLSPGMFGSLVASMFGKCLSSVETLNRFVGKISKKSLLDPTVSHTYQSYATAIRDLINQYWLEISEIESALKSRCGVVTLRVVHDRLRPWLECMEFLSHVHHKVVDPDFEQNEPWTCSLRLLSVLLHEMELIASDRFKKVLLGLFLNCVSPYLLIIGRTIKGLKDPDLKNEFVVYTDSKDNTVKVRNYETLLSELNVPSAEFWDPFVSSSLRAISSVHFITQLNKNSQFSSTDFHPDDLLKDVLSTLGNAISRVAKLEIIEPTDRFCPGACDPKLVSPLLYRLPAGCELTPEQEKIGRIRKKLVSEPFERLYQAENYKTVVETQSDRFMKTLKNAELGLFPVNLMITEVFTSVVSRYREPEGFAYDVLVKDLRLLEHLRIIRRICFVQGLVSFVHTLFEKIMANQQSSCDWTYELRNSILDIYDDEVVERFQCFLTQVSIIDANHPKYVHSALALAKIVYQPDVNLKIVIPDSCMKDYNEIFRFLLQVEWSWYVITKRFLLEIRGIDENPENVTNLRKMSLLRMSLVHLVACLRNYFFTIDEKGFENKIKQLCLEARDLQTIERAHRDFLVECKIRCFLKRKSTCSILVEALLVLCFKCYKLWTLRDRMTKRDVTVLTNEYATMIKRFAVGLQKYERRYSDRLGPHFSHLVNEVFELPGVTSENQEFGELTTRTTSLLRLNVN
ncbi:Spc97 / Spc98 family [Nesidiocoris tenuis]|uniref:Gamma-tubulin complex component n=1 Tax=Nesidiocoris tenuis TaxID=355587 RepID=A0ABN7BAN1_9HEMI|nr:Spc97 / Spc98 family [Nesidiocoris tenuis]